MGSSLDGYSRRVHSIATPQSLARFWSLHPHKCSSLQGLVWAPRTLLPVGEEEEQKLGWCGVDTLPWLGEVPAAHWPHSLANHQGCLGAQAGDGARLSGSAGSSSSCSEGNSLCVRPTCPAPGLTLAFPGQ